MAGIRIGTGEKRIEVNDNGDYIILNLNDNTFIKRFFGLYERLQSMTASYGEQEAAIRAKYKDEEDQNALLGEVFALYVAAGEEMKGHVDALFGEGSCDKIFGGIAPSLDLYLDFFEQLTPYLQQFSQERMQRMSKYSAARTGNV